jgi:hypothetical protein
MSDTANVTMSVAPLTAVHGSKRLRYVTTATLEFDGVTITLQGILIMEHHGRLTVIMPQAKHPLNGMNCPAVSLPHELHRAIEIATLEQLPGQRVLVVGPEEVD